MAGRFVRSLAFALLLYVAVSRFLGMTYRIESVSMEPGLSPGDRVVVSVVAFGPRVPFSRARLPGTAMPRRGDLVVVRPPFLDEPGLLLRVTDPLAAFFTFQKATLRRDIRGGRVNGYMVKRIIGVPGDALRLEDYTASIRPSGASQFVPEQELIPLRYEVVTSSTAKGWSASMPLSGNAGEIDLQQNQYFLLGDNRTDSSDSRSWGAVTLDRIAGKVVFRYWPPRSLGAP